MAYIPKSWFKNTGNEEKVHALFAACFTSDVTTQEVLDQRKLIPGALREMGETEILARYQKNEIVF